MELPSFRPGTTTSIHKSERLFKHLAAAFVFALLLSAGVHGQQPTKPAVSCDSLAKAVLPNATITVAQAYAAGEFKMPGSGPGGAGGQGGPQGGPGGQAGQGGPGGMGMALGQGAPPAATSNPPFCRIAATLKPTSDSDINMEVWLPLSGWNGKFVGVSNMGLGGAIQYRNMLQPLVEGYAAAANDTGHEGNTLSFVVGHPEKLIDYAYRADHEMTVQAKALIKAFFGADPKHSYWVGCSLGGAEALMEAYRYPDDYDGIVAGSPVNPLTRFNAFQMYPAWLSIKYPNDRVPGSKYKTINQAAIQACAGPAGLKQGFIDDPLSCKFDPGVLLCKGDDTPDCLTPPQLEYLRKLYTGAVNPRTGEVIYPGYPYGSEMLLSNDGGAHMIPPALEVYQYGVFKDANWDWKTMMDFDTAIAKGQRELSPILDVQPNLKGFLDHGGRLMIYVGGAEMLNAKGTVKFYSEVLKNSPGKQNQLRLFINPGVGHCGGGNGCDTFEKLETVAQWVESGKAPDQVLSSKVTGGKTIRTRPLCAYPAVAKYKGTGDMDDANSFECVK